MHSDMAYVNSVSEGSFAEQSSERMGEGRGAGAGAGAVEETSNRVLSGWRV